MPLIKKETEDFIIKYKNLLNKIIFVIVLVQNKIKLQYNSKRKDIVFRISNKIYFKLAKETNNKY